MAHFFSRVLIVASYQLYSYLYIHPHCSTYPFSSRSLTINYIRIYYPFAFICFNLASMFSLTFPPSLPHLITFTLSPQLFFHFHSLNQPHSPLSIHAFSLYHSSFHSHTFNLPPFHPVTFIRISSALISTQSNVSSLPSHFPRPVFREILKYMTFS